MLYDFWKNYQKLLSYEQALAFDYRLDNIVLKLNKFFKKLLIEELSKEEIGFFLAGSCIKSDIFRDLDIIFPKSLDRELVNNALDKNYFEYENNSYTYKYKNDIYQLVYKDKFKDATLKELVDGFDFDSTKIAFQCVYNTKKKLLRIIACQMKKEFIMYVNTKVNNLSKVSVNPFVSLQRAIHFLKRGDDVPYSVFLNICEKIAQIKVKENEDLQKYFEKLQGNPNNLSNIKEAISSFIKNKKEEL